MVSPSEGNEVPAKRTSGSRIQRLIVPSSRGNHPEGPRGGKEAPFHEPLEGNMPGTPRPDPVSTKRQRIARVASS